MGYTDVEHCLARRVYNIAYQSSRPGEAYSNKCYYIYTCYLSICSTTSYLLECKIAEIEHNIEIAQNSLNSYKVWRIMIKVNQKNGFLLVERSS